MRISQDAHHEIRTRLLDVTRAAADAEPIWLGALLDQMPVGVVITDAAGRILRANTAARSLRGSCYWPRFSGITGDAETHPVRPHATPAERL